MGVTELADQADGLRRPRRVAGDGACGEAHRLTPNRDRTEDTHG